MDAPRQALFTLAVLLFAGGMASCAAGHRTEEWDAWKVTADDFPASHLPRGQAQAYIVQGDVKLASVDGTTRPVNKGEKIEEGGIVLVGEKSQVLLVLSNGAHIILRPNAQLWITRLRQAPFDPSAEGGTFNRLTRDPSQSVVELYLASGTLQGRVLASAKSLNSRFTITTQAGAFAIGGRDSFVSLSVVREADSGRLRLVLGNTVVGSMNYRRLEEKPRFSNMHNFPETVEVAGGGQIQFPFEANGVKILGAGLARAASQTILDFIYAVSNVARSEGLTIAPPPSVPPPTPPVGIPTAEMIPPEPGTPPLAWRPLLHIP